MDAEKIYAEFGRRVALRRGELDLSQADLAKSIGLSRASVANIERGRQNFLMHYAYRLAHALSVDDLAMLLPALPAVKQDHSRITIVEPEGGLSETARLQIERLYHDGRLEA